MSRPPSIVRFERLYLASFAVGLASWAVNWNVLSTRLAADPRTAPFIWILPVSLLLGVAISLCLWFFVARRGSVIAKWVLVVLTVLAALRFLLNLPAVARGAVPVGDVALSAVTLLLGLVAAFQLFRPDARAWFGEVPAGDVE